MQKPLFNDNLYQSYIQSKTIKKRQDRSPEFNGTGLTDVAQPDTPDPKKVGFEGNLSATINPEGQPDIIKLMLKNITNK